MERLCYLGGLVYLRRGLPGRFEGLVYGWRGQGPRSRVLASRAGLVYVWRVKPYLKGLVYACAKVWLAGLDVLSTFGDVLATFSLHCLLGERSPIDAAVSHSERTVGVSQP